MVNQKCSKLIQKLIPRKLKFVEEKLCVQKTIKSDKPVQLKLMWDWTQKFKVVCGFRNIGTTCYLNSVLQCLLYCTPFYNLLSSKIHSDSCEPKEFCHFCYLETIALKLKTHKSFFPIDIIKRLGALNSAFSPHTEQDAHEFLLCFLDRLEQNSLNAPSRISPIKQIFEGELHSTFECIECNSQSEANEIFLNFSLDIGKIGSVEESLSSYFSTLKLFDPHNLYFCDKCKKKVRATRKLQISTPPNILTIHLKRFIVCSNGYIKNDKRVSFSERLDLSQYISAHENASSHNYLLYGVVIHLGASAESGHYVSIVKGPLGQWHYANDERINEISPSRVFSEKPYMLFYKRQDPIDTKFSQKRKQKEMKGNSLLRKKSIRRITVLPYTKWGKKRNIRKKRWMKNRFNKF